MKARVIVVGAGVAGLTAAKELQAQGYSVTILEARDRIGGRIWTSSKFGYPTDLGASWIEGDLDNPIGDLAKSHGLELLLDNEDEVVTYDSHGRDISTAYDECRDKLEKQLEVAVSDPDCSVHSALEKVPVKQSYLHAYYSELESDSAADAEVWSLKEWARETVLEGDSFLFPQGYVQVPDVLAQNLDIRKNQAVISISQSENSVLVTTQGETFQADLAVITVPLGVLKSGRIVFSPPLPKVKSEAIRLLGMGVLNKVLLQFPEAFWPKDVLNFAYIGTERGEFPSTLNGYALCGQAYLMTFTAGSKARSQEEQPDSVIIDNLLEVYQRMFGVKPPTPTSYQITRWASDPWAKGSYSYRPVGVTDAQRVELGKPFGRIHFAGEATDLRDPATVHGASFSGSRVAREIQLSVRPR